MGKREEGETDGEGWSGRKEAGEKKKRETIGRRGGGGKEGEEKEKRRRREGGRRGGGKRGELRGVYLKVSLYDHIQQDTITSQFCFN